VDRLGKIRHAANASKISRTMRSTLAVVWLIPFLSPVGGIRKTFETA
jgi:hypothetical protein